MKIIKIIEGLKAVAENYFNTITYNLFKGFGLPYWREAKWLLSQLDNVKENDENATQKLLVLLFALQFEKNKNMDSFVNNINETRKSILEKFHYSHDEGDAKFEVIYKNSIEEAIKARKRPEDTTVFMPYQGWVKNAAHSQTDWIQLVNKDCDQALKNGYCLNEQLENKNCCSLDN